MLHGIGGATIAEAKERLSYAEAMAWSRFMRKHGSLHWGQRLEFGFAVLATLLNRAYGGTAVVEDFMPYAEPKEATIEDVMKILTGAIRK